MNTRDILATLQLRGVGPSSVRFILNALLANSAADTEIVALLRAHSPKRFAAFSSQQVHVAYAEADRLLECSQDSGVFALSPLDEAYPRALLGIPDYPPVIYVKGSIQTLTNAVKMAVVGTRQASDLGLRLAKKISADLSSKNVCVVSGLALGIDAAAHRGALKGTGSTIAVLAHGLDQVFPKANQGLASEILESNGVLLSEYEVGITPRPPQFVFRNRLQSGLSRGSIVVESGFTGGSIYQGKFTTEQRRLLFVVMPSSELPGVNEFNREGGERLQREFHAKAVSRFEEIIDAITEVDPRTIHEKDKEAKQELAPKKDEGRQQDLFND